MSHLTEKYINPLINFDFKKIFETPELAKFSPKEIKAYEDSLKYYRDLKNVVDTSKEEGIEIGKEAERKKIAKLVKAQGININIIKNSTGLSEKEINEL